MSKNDIKQQVGNYAAKLVQNHTTVGLGTGTTVSYFLVALAQRIKKEHLDIVGVTTSEKTTLSAKELGIRIVDIDDTDGIDLTIDGADEVDTYLNGIKGGGAALLMEKIVAKNSKENVWIVDESKVHNILGSFPLPVEVVPFGSGRLYREFALKGLNPRYRVDNLGRRIVTDAQHYIIDLVLDAINNPYELAQYLESRVGVVEHGLFLGIANRVIVGNDDDIEVLERRTANQKL